MSVAVFDRSPPNIGMASAEPDLLDTRFLDGFTHSILMHLLVGPALVQLLLNEAGWALTNITTAQLRVPGRF